MTRFSRVYIEYLRRAVPPSFIIQQVIDPKRLTPIRLYPLRKLGKNPERWIGLSPFSNERTPSFVVYDDLRSWKCYSTQHGGDIFEFLRYFPGMYFNDAVSLVGALNAVEGVPERKGRRIPRRNKKEGGHWQ